MRGWAGLKGGRTAPLSERGAGGGPDAGGQKRQVEGRRGGAARVEGAEDLGLNHDKGGQGQ